jgi:2-dehydro-3-deoxyphosphooctonate aldolase (KDO 8-P synthase)
MTQQRTVAIGNVTIAADRPFALIAGPCAIESREHALMMAGELKALCAELGVPLIYKSSFDKANRTSAATGRGLGLERGLEILAEVKHSTGLPVLTDVHESWQCVPVGEVVDVLQIPAFLCRQTDLLKAAAETGRALNVKKGQFLAPWDMAQVAAKVESFGCERLLLCERGSSFGYNTLVSDMRSLPQLAATGWPVIFDATHSVQQPGGLGGRSGGQREFVPVLARAALAVGVAGVFIETHDNPDKAISDGPNMVPLGAMRSLLQQLQRFDALAKELPLPSF